ncbi:MAG: radical SAM protein [Anaeromyxobacteraceae bacterium]
MRVLFTSAPEPGSAAESAGAWLPLALIHLAGAARAAGHEVEVVDALSLGLGSTDIDRILQTSAPDVLCVSAATAGFPAAMEVCRRARALGCTTVVGGVHASFMYPEFLPSGAADFAVVGEGEETLPDLLRCLEAGEDPARVAGIAFALGGRVIRTAPRPRLAALDPLPKAWDLVDWARYAWAGRPAARMAAITTSRGCPRRCPGCAQSALHEGTVRTRAVESVAYELTQLRREHGAEVVVFYDHAPAADGRRFAQLAGRLAELDLGLDIVLQASVSDLLRDEAMLPRWRAAGVVHVGICRDPSEERLPADALQQAGADGRRVVHALRDAGITSEAPFWIGFPDETQATVEATLARAQAWDPDLAHFPLLAPLPYTQAWRTYGTHVTTRDYRRFDNRHAVVKPKEMALAEVEEAAARCYRAFYAARSARDAVRDGRQAGPWRVHPPAPALRDRILQGATEEERRALGPQPYLRRN